LSHAPAQSVAYCVIEFIPGFPYNGAMRWIKLFCILWIGYLGSVPGWAASARIIKVLPHYLDAQGLHALSPSLYERDAYQVKLRNTPQLQAGIRFDVQWKAPTSNPTPLRLRVELHTSKTGMAQTREFQAEVMPRRRFSRWSSIMIKGQDFQDLGTILAWRVSLWQGERKRAELKSFLW
jgi:hypothetical protein